MVERPAGVPGNAVWKPSDGEWVVVPVDEQGRDHGTARYWRADGTLACRREYRHGQPHGPYERYHESGEASRAGTHVDGAPHGVDTCYRSTAPTTERAFDTNLPAAIVRCEIDMVHGLGTSTRLYDRDGNEVSLNGEPVPPRPDGVPPEAFYSPREGWWFAGQWDAEIGPGARVGLCRFWHPDGDLVRLEYHRAGRHPAVADRIPGHESRGNPLVEAAVDGDHPAVAACLAAGLGGVSGAAPHAAYAGLPDLTRRLSHDVDVMTERWPDAPEPRRPANVEPGAVWVSGLGSRGGWLLGTVDPGTGEAVGTWRMWKVPLGDDPRALASWERVEFTGGRPARRQDFYGFRLRRERDRDRAARAHVDGFPLREEIHYGSTGEVQLRRRFDGEPGQLANETETLADDIVAHRTFHPGGRLCRERVEQGGALLSEHWWAPDGTRTAVVLPVADDFPELDDAKEVELWRGLDGDRAVVEGLVVQDGGHGGPVGPWRLLETGEDVSFAPLTGSSLGLNRRHDLTTIALALRTWQRAPWPPGLAGIDEIDWPALRTYFGSAEHFPFLLKGLSRPEPVIFDVALEQLVDPVLHQGTIEEATGPVIRFAVAIVPSVTDEALRGKLLGFIAAVATRGGNLGAAAELKAIRRQLPAGAADPGEHFGDCGVEPAYHEVYSAISDATAVWADLADGPDRWVRHWAMILLAVADGASPAETLCRHIASTPDRIAAAEGLLGLALHEPTGSSRARLSERIIGPDPLLAFCAAMTWLQLRAEPSAPAVDRLLAVLGGRLDTTGFEELYLRSDSATADAATTLALLPPEQAAAHLARLCAALDRVGAVDAISVARALLDIVFPNGYQAEPLSHHQRRVVGAIAASHNVWTFNANLHEVLRYNNLPTDRDRLRAIATGR